MILKASDFLVPDSVRLKYFPMVLRASPPDGWPDGAVMITKGRSPYRSFLQLVGAPRRTEFSVEIGEYKDGDTRVFLSIIEEVSVNCPLKEEEALWIKREYEISCRAVGEERPALFVQGLIPPVFSAFDRGILSFPAALALSLYANTDTQREILGLGVSEQSPECLLGLLGDPFFAGDLFNHLERETEKLKALGYSSLLEFVQKRSLISYPRARFLMRLAAAIPREKRQRLTGDQGELLLCLSSEDRETVLHGGRASIGDEDLDFNRLCTMSRPEARRLIKRARGKNGDNLKRV